MSITISLIAGPFDDIVTWPFRGTIQISVFRQDNSGLIWTNLLKTNDKPRPALHAHHPCNLTRVVVSSSTFPMRKCSKHTRTWLRMITSISKKWSLTSREPRFQFQQPWTSGEMSCSTYSKKKKKEKTLRKLKLKTIIFNIRHFDCRWASLKMSPNLFTRQN